MKEEIVDPKENEKYNVREKFLCSCAYPPPPLQFWEKKY
jgi:hypothetical protein